MLNFRHKNQQLWENNWGIICNTQLKIISFEISLCRDKKKPAVLPTLTGDNLNTK
jgi:hypothetical protein